MVSAELSTRERESALFGAVASDPVISQLVTRLAADAPVALKAMGQARRPCITVPDDGQGIVSQVTRKQ
jgi:hypothetical protein